MTSLSPQLRWLKDDVTVGFTCADALSGIPADGCPASTILGEGANQSASGTVTDAAGNSASAEVTGINVDKTPPTLTGTPSVTGWSRDTVTVTWDASDSLSGLAGSVPASSTVTGEGNNLSASASISDRADNTAVTTVSGIKIDRTAPSTSVSVEQPLATGWYDKDVDVTLTGVDALSGVAATYYSIDGGEAKPYAASFTHSLKGGHTITFWSVDSAGNVEDKTKAANTVEIKVDTSAPTIVGSRSPAANGFGWNNTNVTVHFECTDSQSGVAIANCTPDTLLSNEGEGQSTSGTATDNVGKTASTTVDDISIDKTNPTLSGTATTSPNAYGWYRGDVTIRWTGQDGLSGIDTTTQPANSVITSEGSNLGAGPASISDKAGNVGSGSVSGIKIDRTAPTISGKTVNDNGTARSANASGWFNSAVRVRFTCADTLSTVQECAGDVVLSGDGANQSASGTATDKADNSASATVTGIKIDSQASTTDSDLQCTGKNGFCRGSKATVVITAADQTPLSGVKEIRYSTNNGSSWQTVPGASASVDLNLSGNGKAKVLFYAIDHAGNSETQNGVEVKYDTIAPVVTHDLNPAANAAGWNKADVTVHFDATDDSDGSGVDPATVTADQTISTETTGTVVNGEAYDLAGNKGTNSVTVKLDKTAPTISGAATTSPSAGGWYKGAVTVRFTCADSGTVQSGVATCPADVVLSTDGTNQSVTGTVTDQAGNTVSVTVSGINIDSTKPTISSMSVTNGAIYTLGDPAIPSGTQTCTASDSASGIASCLITVSGGKANGVGTFSFTATATDKASNMTTQTGSYRVIYRFDGFAQPINDTAHQIDQNVSVFKGGSTVPVKLQLRKADGTVVQANTLPLWLSPVKGSRTTASVDESVYAEQATSGNTYKYDATAQQYSYNWSTKGSTSGYFYRIGVTLDDGQTYYVSIGLR